MNRGIGTHIHGKLIYLNIKNRQQDIASSVNSGCKQNDHIQRLKWALLFHYEQNSTQTFLKPRNKKKF